MNIYEVNQMAYNSLPPIAKEDILAQTKRVQEFLQANPSKYYMLLCNECKYYTLFTFTDGFKFKEMANEIIDIIISLGDIVSIEFNETDFEVWVKDEETSHVFYFFNYEPGVIEV